MIFPHGLYGTPWKSASMLFLGLCNDPILCELDNLMQTPLINAPIYEAQNFATLKYCGAFLVHVRNRVQFCIQGSVWHLPFDIEDQIMSEIIFYYLAF